MQKTSRRKLFYSLVILFFLIGGSTIFYIEGWRVDIVTLSIQKIGAIYVRSFPEEATLLINNRPIKRNLGLFQTGTLINHLFPKTYEVKLSFPNYQPWQMHVAVEPSLVSEIKYAVLVPAKPTLVFSGPIKNFWVMNQEVIVKNEQGNLIARGQNISGNHVSDWTNDLKNVLTLDEKTNTYFWNNLEDGSIINISSALQRASLLAGKPTEVLVDREANSRLILIATSSISLFDIQKNSLTAVYSEKNSTTINAALSRFWLTWTIFDKKNNTSRLFLYDRFLGTRKSPLPILQGKTKKMAWATNNRIGILQEGGEFYLYDVATDALSKLASDVKDFAFTEKGSRVAALEHKSFEVFSLEGQEDYWRFNPKDVEQAQSVRWYRDEQHLFIEYPGSVAFLDLRDSGQENFQTVTKTTRSQYDPLSNQFYFLENGKLLRLDFPG